MTLAERDAYIIARLATLKAQGMSSSQAVNEVIRTSGFAGLALQGHDQAALVADVAALQTATVNLAVPAVRTTTVATTVVAKQALHPAPSGVPTADVYHMRAVSAGA